MMEDDCTDAGGRAPTIGALGNAGSGCRGRIASGTAIESTNSRRSRRCMEQLPRARSFASLLVPKLELGNQQNGASL